MNIFCPSVVYIHTNSSVVISALKTYLILMYDFVVILHWISCFCFVFCLIPFVGVVI